MSAPGEGSHRMRLRAWLAEAAQSHPVTWKVAWETVRRLPFLQPHDPSLRAVRHFVAARPPGLLLDIGANDGISSAYFRRIAPASPILAIEPNRIHGRRLEAMKGRDPLFDFQIVACSDKDGTLALYTPHYVGIALHTFSNSSIERAKEAMAEAFGPSIAQSATFTEQVTPVRCVDELELEPTVMKIDAEGHDQKIIVGASRTIDRCRPFIVFEAGPDIDRKWFEERGYGLFTYSLGADLFEALADDKPRSASGHRNIFAIPMEMEPLIPVRKAS